ncbi:MAG: hypothetical protein JWP83_5376 [Mycobacterium sp.]|jgi:hypothetical protein|nr:hypothetical protein [Mycobacterium sp.]
MCSVSCPQTSTGWAPPGPPDPPRAQQNPPEYDLTHPSAIPVLVRLFRSVASVDIDKNVRRLREFVDEQIDGFAIAGGTRPNGTDAT